MRIISACWSARTGFFGGLMVAQWLFGLLMAFTVSPLTWQGEFSSVSIHVWTAICLGGAITLFPVILVLRQPGKQSTRQVVAVAQMLYGAMLIHLTGGRIETHFHVFGSLAFLAFYRDWKVLITASAIVAADHFLRGLYWPRSVFGVLTAGHLRWLEHAGWVVFEDMFLIAACRRGILEMREVARRHAALEATNSIIDARVQERTAELAEARDSLEEKVAERTSELEVTLKDLQVRNEQLREANAHKSKFLSTMSHELRTPLNAIIGFADLLAGEGFGPLNDKQRSYIKRIDDSGAHLLSLITDVLDVAKIDAGAMELNIENLPVEELLGSSTQMMAQQYRNRNIQLHTESLVPRATVRADSRKARQILINLLSNALKYSPLGGEVVVRAEQASPDTIRISVIDHGVGIEAEQQSKIFQEFHQADRQRDEGLGGIGLGLALTKRLVELHKGEIGVESTVGEGSTFWFTLPAGEAMKQPKGEQAPEEFDIAPSTTKHVILIAEDNEANLTMLCDMLSLKQYELLIAHNGLECLEMALEHHPDLIITDMRMPVMDGLESVRRMREHPQLASIPIIALTANASEISRDACIGAGCNEHLTKPVKSKQLFPMIEKMLSPEEPLQAAI